MSVVVMYVCKMRRGTAWHRVSHTCETRCPIMLTLGPRLPPCAAGPTGGVVSRGTSHFFSPPHAVLQTSCIHHGEKKAGPQVWRSKTLAQPQRYQTVRLMHSRIENTIRKSRLWLKQAGKRAKSDTRNSLRHPCFFSTMPPWDRPTAYWWTPTLSTSAYRIRSSSFRG